VAALEPEVEEESEEIKENRERLPPPLDVDAPVEEQPAVAAQVAADVVADADVAAPAADVVDVAAPEVPVAAAPEAPVEAVDVPVDAPEAEGV